MKLSCLEYSKRQRGFKRIKMTKNFERRKRLRPLEEWSN